MSSGSLTNPFSQADAWETSTDTYLGVGNHRVRIVKADDATAQSSGNPQIALEFENSEGTKNDWCPYHAEFLGKVVALFQSAGVELPKDGEFDLEDNCRLTEACRRRLLGKEIGIVIRLEKSQDGKERPRVQGYVAPDRVKVGSDLPVDTSDLPSGGGSDDDDIPF